MTSSTLGLGRHEGGRAHCRAESPQMDTNLQPHMPARPWLPPLWPFVGPIAVPSSLLSCAVCGHLRGIGVLASCGAPPRPPPPFLAPRLPTRSSSTGPGPSHCCRCSGGGSKCINAFLSIPHLGRQGGMQASPTWRPKPTGQRLHAQVVARGRAACHRVHDSVHMAWPRARLG